MRNFVRGLNFLVLSVLFGTSAVGFGQGTGYWHTSGNQILDGNNKVVRIAGVNWYGFETSRAVVGGLTAQDYKAILQTIKRQGYNTIRVPMSNQMMENPGSNLNISYSNGSGAINSDLQGLNSLQVLDKIVGYAGALGLKVILDNRYRRAGLRRARTRRVLQLSPRLRRLGHRRGWVQTLCPRPRSI